MKKVKLFFALMLMCMINPLFAQNSKIAQSLLWRISGNGLKKPSYLYGTVHLRHQQLFNFGDSLYQSIEKTDGFALELNPEQVSDAVVSHLDRNEQKVYLREKLKKNDFEKFRKALKKAYDIDAESMTVKEFYNLKDRLMLPEVSTEDMSTFMDAWLYSIAKGQGKLIAGLEDIEDQFNPGEIENYELDPRDVKEIFRQVKAGKEYVKQMLLWYQQQDILMLQRASRMSADSNQHSVFTKRNQKMAHRFDSLIKRDLSYFVAVGAAHLAGEEGVIALMLEKGYKVEPVYSSRKIPAGQYVFKKAPIKWQEYTEPSLGFTVMMPGKPSPSEMLEGEMKVRMYYDLASGMVYYVSFVRSVAPVTEQNKDSIFTNMINATINNGGELISKQIITRYGFPGIEIFYKNKVDDMFIRMQILAKGRKIYMVMIGSQKKQSLENDTDDFFTSFKILDDVPAQWTVIPNSEDAFEMSWPQAPELTRLDNETVDSTISAKRYMSILENEGIYYVLMVSRTTPGFIIPDDSLYLVGIYNNLKNQYYQSLTLPERFAWQGYPAAKMNAVTPAGLQLQARILIRGNRIYSAMVMYEKEKEGNPQIEKFFTSLKLTPYQLPTYSQVSSASKDFTVELPAAALNDNSDSTEKAIRTYSSFDTVRATNYAITHKVLSPYFWAKSDTGLLRTEVERFRVDNDSLVSFSFTNNGTSKGINYALKSNNSNLVHFIRVILQGRNLYYLESRTTADQDAAMPVDHFFNSFKPLSKTVEEPVTATSPKKLFDALKSSDSLVYNPAYQALLETEFTPDQRDILINEAIKTFPADSSHYRSVNDIIFDNLYPLQDSALIPIIKEIYPLLTREQEQFKYNILSILSNIKTRDAYNLISSLLSAGLPTEGRATKFFYYMHDSLQLTRQILPSLLRYAGDSILSFPLAYLQQTMLDSNLIANTDVISYKRQWVAFGSKRLAQISDASRDYATFDSDLINVLLSYNDKEANKIVVGYLSAAEVDLKKQAFLGLIKLGEPVSQYHAAEIAADKNYRVAFYEDLVKDGNEKLFPRKYLNQKSFAEGYLYRSFDEDEEPYKVIPIGERVAMFKDKKEKFFLYKVVYKYDEEEFTNLGISGPFPINSNSVLTSYSIAGVTDEDFAQSKINEQLKTYLEAYEL